MITYEGNLTRTISTWNLVGEEFIENNDGTYTKTPVCYGTVVKFGVKKPNEKFYTKAFGVPELQVCSFELVESKVATFNLSNIYEFAEYDGEEEPIKETEPDWTLNE